MFTEFQTGATIRARGGRFLIAYDVDLGKTIEAGLILRELNARR
jgi:hypothetical protein